MTGKEVVQRAMSYKRDVARLGLRISLARDALTRITRPMSAQGGSGGGPADKIGQSVGEKNDFLEAMRARRTCFLLEIEEAARLIARLEPPECGEVMRHTCVLGETQRQVAAATHRSEGSVRGLRRRGWRALEEMHSDLDGSAEYKRALNAYEQATAGYMVGPARRL